MTDFLLALALVVALLFGFWIMSRLDLFLNSLKDEQDDENSRR